MTSQKRNRHHQENNAAVRFKDLPPRFRFKRQKSSSSPKPEESDTGNQENEVCAPLAVSSAQRLPTDCSDSHSCAPVNSTQMKQPFGIINGQPARYGAWSCKMLEDPSSLSVDTGIMNYPFPVRDVLSGEYMLPQNYLSPPMSPWGLMDNGITSATDFVPKPTYSQNVRASPGLIGNRDTLSPALEMAKAVGGVTLKGQADDFFQDRLSNASSPMPVLNPKTVPSPLSTRPSPLSTPSPTQDVINVSQLSPSSSNSGENSVDYSDPDIRTIEMLRELERVADQKEKEDEADAGVDRKNLVSHHLRMLMCAVDRYTADLPEDCVDSDVPSSKSGSPSPSFDNENYQTALLDPVKSVPGQQPCSLQGKPFKKQHYGNNYNNQGHGDHYHKRNETNSQDVRNNQKWSRSNQVARVNQLKPTENMGKDNQKWNTEHQTARDPPNKWIVEADRSRHQQPSHHKGQQWSNMQRQQQIQLQQPHHTRQLYTDTWQAALPPQSHSPALIPVTPAQLVTSQPPPPTPRQILSNPNRTSSPHISASALATPPPNASQVTAPVASNMSQNLMQSPVTNNMQPRAVNSYHGYNSQFMAKNTVMFDQRSPEVRESQYPIWGPMTTPESEFNLWEGPSPFWNAPFQQEVRDKGSQPLYNRW